MNGWEFHFAFSPIIHFVTRVLCSDLASPLRFSLWCDHCIVIVDSIRGNKVAWDLSWKQVIDPPKKEKSLHVTSSFPALLTNLLQFIDTQSHTRERETNEWRFLLITMKRNRSSWENSEHTEIDWNFSFRRAKGLRSTSSKSEQCEASNKTTYKGESSEREKWNL